MSSCCCRKPARFVFACSGASDVGEIADRVARRLTRAGLGEMHSLAGVNAGIEAVVKEAKAARSMLVIDGCSSACASVGLERAGFTNFPRIDLSNLGLTKGNSPATPENIEHVVAAVRARFQ